MEKSEIHVCVTVLAIYHVEVLNTSFYTPESDLMVPICYILCLVNWVKSKGVGIIG